MTSTIIISFAVGVLAILLLAKLIGLSIGLIIKFLTNSVIGAFMLIIINLFGANLDITILKALFAGIFGIPGVIAILIWDKML